MLNENLSPKIAQAQKAIDKLKSSLESNKKTVQGSYSVFKSLSELAPKMGFNFELSSKKFIEFAEAQKKAAKEGKALQLSFNPESAVDAITKMNTATDILQAALFTGLGPVIGMVSDVLTDMAYVAGEVANVLQENEGVVKAVALVVGGLALVITAYNFGVSVAAALTEGLTIATEILSTATAVLNGTMALNPFGLVAVALVAVGVAVYALWKNFKEFREVVSGVWEVIKNTFSNMWSAATTFVNSITKIFSGLWKVISNPFDAKKGFDEIGTGIKDAATSMVKAVPIVAATTAVLNGSYKKGVQGRDVFEEAEKAKQHPANAKGVSSTSGEESGSGAMPSATAVQSRPSSINITINKLVERIEIQSTTVKEGVGQLEEMITRTLVAAVNDFQKTASV